MRGTTIVAGLLVALAGLAGLAGCADEPIGQPCTFSWPVANDGSTDCTSLPACQPLQAAIHMPAAPANDACPVDCIQMPSLQCTNLICVATQAEEAEDQPPDNVMNGQCSADVVHDDCLQAPFGCMGYCTKECLSDASCPKGYRCSSMAPFGESMRCDDENLWGDGLLSPNPDNPDTTKQCTDGCSSTGTVVGEDPDTHVPLKCPSSRATDGASYDYSLCDQKDYQKCCACMCYQYCPLLTKKFCRKVEWDHKMFPTAITTRSDCKQTP
jgi:hypothetical protein